MRTFPGRSLIPAILFSGPHWVLAQAEKATEAVTEKAAPANELGEWLEKALNIFNSVWNFEISAVEGSAITVSSVIQALTLVVLGFFLSRYLANLISRTLGKRLKCDEGAIVAIRTIAFYILLCTFTLLGLRAVSFPLAVFTVIGGALAIGIGFGSQNVMNNFISGLILLIERPIRPKDVVEIEGSHGVVEKIGARSTQLRSTDGRHIVVPNSFFLQNNLINWTLSDDLMRTKVSVGVAYGSDTALVEKCILQCIKDEKGMLEDPAPQIIFESFGDNSLVFDIYFWLYARSPMSMRQVSSRFRFALDRAFRENNIVISFPQRDVHLDFTGPLDVNITNKK